MTLQPYIILDCVKGRDWLSHPVMAIASRRCVADCHDAASGQKQVLMVALWVQVSNAGAVVYLPCGGLWRRCLACKLGEEDA